VFLSLDSGAALIAGTAVNVAAQEKFRVDGEDANIGFDYYLANYGDGVMAMADRKGPQFILSHLVGTHPKARGRTPESLRLIGSSVLDGIK
jgi:glucan phosphoethanolaminetransferase (alkaline phosphatase superfamily)